MSAARCTLLAGLLLALSLVVALRADENSLAAEEKTLTDAGLRTDAPSLLEFFRKRTPSEADLARLTQAVRRLGDVSFPIRENASRELIAAGRSAVPFLRAALKNRDLEVVRRAERCLEEIENRSEAALIVAATRLLSARRPAGATEAFLNYLPFIDDIAVEEEVLAALGIVGVRDGKAEPVLLAALRDVRPATRAAAALVVGRLQEAPPHPTRPLLDDPDARVRLRAAQGLIAGKEKTAIPTLVALLADAPPEIAWQAEELLCRIAGDQAPQLSAWGSSEAERRKCRDEWASWWRERGAGVELARIDLGQRTLGLTLLVAYDGFKGNGRVWETGPDGKLRWEVNDVQGPLDAEVLPGNRVLIAEYGGHRVTERDQQGKVLWEHHVNTLQPVACQRLPNGNTLIATNNEIAEITPGHTAVATYPSNHGLIFATQKLRNGHLVYVTYEGLLIELDDKGKEVRTFKFDRPTDGLVTVEVLPGGRYLIPQTSAGKVVEFDGNGKAIWQCAVANPNAATRLANGNTLVCSRRDKRVVEVDRAGKVVWEQVLDGHLFRVRRR